MTRPRTCEHLAACVNEDGTAIDGGTPLACDIRPCTECGALCPGSIWTPEYAFEQVQRAFAEYRQLVADTDKQVAMYEAWVSLVSGRNTP